MDIMNVKRIEFAQTIASMQKRLGEQLCQTLAHPGGKVYNPISVMDELRMWADHIEKNFVSSETLDKNEPVAEKRTVYVIARDVREGVHYWHPSIEYDDVRKEYGSWTPECDFDWAVYFSNADSARQVLYKACGGIGRVEKREILVLPKNLEKW